VQGTDQGEGGTSIVTAYVPTSEILRYAIDLRSLTGGRGRFVVEHDHYDVLPQHLYDKVTAATKA
jgi:elongation factor G